MAHHERSPGAPEGVLALEFESAEVDDATAPRQFWPMVWNHLLDQPRPCLAAVVATAVGVVVMLAAPHPFSAAAAGEGRPPVGDERHERADVAAPPVSTTASPPAPPPPPSPPPPPPPSRRERYRLLAEEAAQRCPGLPAGVLFAMARVETNYGRDKRVSKAGAMGPMQFLPRTWRAYATDGDGDGRHDINNPADAVHTAAHHLCRNGGAEPGRLRSAIWNYNHSRSYVDRVMRLAGEYGS